MKLTCNWCKLGGEISEFDTPKELREHKRTWHDADRFPMFAKNRSGVTDLDIVRLIRSGESIRTAADILGTSHNTVAYRLARIVVRKIHADLDRAT